MHHGDTGFGVRGILREAARAAETAGVKQQAGAGAQLQIRMLVLVASDGSGVAVGDGSAAISPFILDDRGVQAIVDRALARSDAVVGHHKAGAVFFLHGVLESAQLDFTELLLVNPGVHTAAVLIVIIADKMLQVYIQALGLSAAHFGSSTLTGQQRIFGEVLTAASIERSPVGIRTGRVPAIHACYGSFAAHALADLAEQIHIPGSRHQRLGGVFVSIVV